MTAGTVELKEDKRIRGVQCLIFDTKSASSPLEDGRENVFDEIREQIPPKNYELEEKKKEQGDIDFVEKELKKIVNSHYGTSISRALANEEIEIPPIKYALWAKMPSLNTRLGRCIRTYARNTVGLGWEIVPGVPLNEDTPQEVKDTYKEEKILLETLFENPNDDIPFSEVMYLTKTDEETFGNGYLEVQDNGNKGIVEGLHHVPGISTYLLKNKRGYVQVTEKDVKTYFKPFGITDQDVAKKFGAKAAIMDSRTGKYVGEKLSNGDFQAPPPIEYRASSMIHFKLYDPSSTKYGLPRFVSCGISISGTHLANRRNLAYFNNDATPRIAVIVSGGRLDPDSIDDLKKFMEAGKGPENAHRCMVLQAEELTEGMLDESRKVEVRIEKLTVGTVDEASHVKYVAANDEEVRECYGIAQIYFKSTDTNKASSIIGKKVTDEQEFEPDRATHEYQINHKILKKMGIKYAKFRFKRPQVADEVEKSLIMNALTNQAAITPNEIREKFGMGAFPESHAFAKKPLKIALEEYKLGLSLLTTIVGVPDNVAVRSFITDMAMDANEKLQSISLDDFETTKAITLKFRDAFKEAFEVGDTEFIEKSLGAFVKIGTNPIVTKKILSELLEQKNASASS